MKQILKDLLYILGTVIILTIVKGFIGIDPIAIGFISYYIYKTWIKEEEK